MSSRKPHSEETKAKLRRTKTDRSTATPATHPATIRELEWAAGFLEGEGSFLRQGSSEAVVARQVNPEPIHRLLALFGGALHVRKPLDRFGKQDQLEWHCTGARARGVMMTLYPLLTTRRQAQIEVALVS